MIIFVNDDGSYRSWVIHHRQGFVLDGYWRKTLRHLMLHRATCGEMRIAPGKSTHATTGGRFKACSASHEELVGWSEQRADVAPEHCSHCRPTDLPSMDSPEPHQKLSRLSAEILDYVLDVAVIHLDDPRSVYKLVVSDIAECLGKTAAQLNDALRRLTDEGLITIGDPLRRSHNVRDIRTVVPTAAALQTLPAFADLGAEELAFQVALLQAT